MPVNNPSTGRSYVPDTATETTTPTFSNNSVDSTLTCICRSTTTVTLQYATPLYSTYPWLTSTYPGSGNVTDAANGSLAGNATQTNCASWANATASMDISPNGSYSQPLLSTIPYYTSSSQIRRIFRRHTVFLMLASLLATQLI